MTWTEINIEMGTDSFLSDTGHSIAFLPVPLSDWTWFCWAPGNKFIGTAETVELAKALCEAQ